MMSERAPDLLVFEPAPRGHGREWLNHLAAHGKRRASGPQLVFVVAPAVAEGLRCDLAPEAAGTPAIIAMSERETARCNHPNLVVSAMARWSAMRRYLRATGAREGLFLEFDHLSLPLALGLPTIAGTTISGILFRPSVHYAHTASSTFKERLRERRKDMLYRLMLRRACLRQVHTLDEGFPQFAAARYRDGAKVTALPDPAHPPVQPDAGDRFLAERAPPDRTLLVLFGVLTERKGILALLQALKVMDPEQAARTAVIIAGEVDPPIEAEVDRVFDQLPAAQPDIWCHLEHRRLRIGEIAALVEQADFVLAPYQRFVGSSGILMWAAGHGRPVIAQDYGLVGHLVRSHGLGLTADTTDPFALARVCSQVAGATGTSFVDTRRLAAFAAGRTPAAFAAGVLDPLCVDAAVQQEAVACTGSDAHHSQSAAASRPVTE